MRALTIALCLLATPALADVILDLDVVRRSPVGGQADVPEVWS